MISQKGDKRELFWFPTAPEQAGGAAPPGERAARQSLRAAGRVGPRAGAEEPQAGCGQADGAAEGPEVRRGRGGRGGARGRSSSSRLLSAA